MTTSILPIPLGRLVVHTVRQRHLCAEELVPAFDSPRSGEFELPSKLWIIVLQMDRLACFRQEFTFRLSRRLYDLDASVSAYYPEASFEEITSPSMITNGASLKSPCTRRVPHLGECVVFGGFSFNEINKLNVINRGQNSDSLRLHVTLRETARPKGPLSLQWPRFDISPNGTG